MDRGQRKYLFVKEQAERVIETKFTYLDLAVMAFGSMEEAEIAFSEFEKSGGILDQEEC